MPIRSTVKSESYYDRFSNSGDEAQSPYPWIFPFGDRGLFLGGQGGSPQEDREWIDYLDITTTGNAADFGDLIDGNKVIQGCSNAARGVVAGGADSPHDVIQYNTIAILGNATDFGDLTQARRGVAAGGSKTRGVFAGGQVSPSNSVPGGSGQETIDYITMDTTGNAQDFGNLPYSRTGMFGSSNGTVMIIGGGDDGNEADDIARLTIATTGNAVDFGSLDPSGSFGYKAFGGAASDATRWVIGGGRLNQPGPAGYRTDQIEYVNYGNYTSSSDFGNLRSPVFFNTGATSNATRALFSGGDAGGSLRSYIDFVTVQTTADAGDFGDLVPHTGSGPRQLHAAYSGQA